MHDGSKLYLKKLEEDYDPTDKISAMRRLHETAAPRRVRDRPHLHRARQGRLPHAAERRRRAAGDPAARARPSRARGRSTRSWKSRSSSLEAASNDGRVGLIVALLPCCCGLRRRGRRRAAAAPLTVDDLYNLRDVRDPQRSPDGKWVAYTVTARHPRDRQERHRRLDGELGRHPADPAHLVARTASRGRAGAPTTATSRSSPRARARRARRSGCWTAPAAKPSRSRDVKGGVADYAWSPDSKRLVLVVEDPDPRDPPRRDDGHGQDRPAEDAAADRHRSLSVQGGRRRLPARRALAPVSLRRRVQESRDPHCRHASTRTRRRGRPTAGGSRSSAGTAKRMSTRRRTATSSSSRRGPARNRSG